MTTVTQKPANPHKVREWFYSYVSTLHSPDPRKALREMNTEGRARSYVLPGRMYLYMYAPKYEATLPYYDRFPLAIPFRLNENGFTALNMHYLAPMHRKLVFDSFLPFISVGDGTTIDAARLQLTYETMSKLATHRYFAPAVKSYLNNHIRSRLMIVPVTEWNMVMNMPFERFVYPQKPNVTSRTRR